MKYFIDTEFIESFHKPFLGKKRHFIDLISIGIVSEDGREYYAISNEFNPRDASQWVYDNVIMNLEGTVSYPELWKSNEQIRSELYQFITCPKGDSVEFYGYYSDYDWVLFCSLFGTMMDLPKGMPMYCKDIKQIMDQMSKYKWDKTKDLTEEEFYEVIKKVDRFPKQTNEHNALADAKWNKELYFFLSGLKKIDMIKK